MDSQKSSKQGHAKGFLAKNRKKILKSVVVLAVLAITAGLSYNAGVKQASTNAKPTVTAPALANFKESAKKAAESAKKNSTTKSTSNTNSSGFFRLSGVIQSNKNNTIAIKLGDGTVVTLTVSDKTKFYTGTPRAAKPIADLKTGTSAFIIGTIGANGTFTASNIQAQK